MRYWSVLLSVALLLVSGCESTRSGQNGSSATAEASDHGGMKASSDDDSKKEGASASESENSKGKTKALGAPPEGLAQATFAGGCFWCMEPPFDETEGVDKTVVGYTGGEKKHPSYDQVAGGETDHAEAIRVYYDPDEVSYDELLTVFWHHIDPTDANGQFVDRGSQYRTAIFYHDEAQKKAAVGSKKDLDENGPFEEPIVTEIQPAETFWRAEDYHQNFYEKSPGRYHSYHSNSGRKEFFEKYWGE